MSGGYFGHYCGIGEEPAAAVGTLVARSQFSRVYQGSSMKLDFPRTDRTILGERDPELLFEGKKIGNTRFVVPALYDGHGLLLKHAAGKLTDAGSGPTYTHTYDFDDTDPYSRASDPLGALSAELFMFTETGHESLLGNRQRVAEFGFEFAENEEPKFTFDMVGRLQGTGPKTASPSFPSLATEEANWFQMAAFVKNPATAGSWASLPTGIRFSIRINNNLRTDRGFLGDPDVAAPVINSGKRNIEGSLELEWSNAASPVPTGRSLYEAFVDGTEIGLRFLATGTGGRLFEMLIPRAIFTGETPDPAEGTVLPQNLPFRALRDSTLGAPMQIIQTNLSATA